MNKDKFQTLLTKTAALDTATMLLYKFAAVNAAAAAARQPAVRKTISEIVKNVLNKGVKAVANEAGKMSQAANFLNHDLKMRADKLFWNSRYPYQKKMINKDILHQIAALLKNKLTIGAGVGAAANAGLAGGAGYLGYKAYKNKAAEKAAPVAAVTEEAAIPAADKQV